MHPDSLDYRNLDNFQDPIINLSLSRAVGPFLSSRNNILFILLFPFVSRRRAQSLLFSRFVHVYESRKGHGWTVISTESN